MSNFVKNSPYWSPEWVSEPLIYFSIAFAIAIILHRYLILLIKYLAHLSNMIYFLIKIVVFSAYINGWKYHSVRILTDVAAWSFLTLNILLLIGVDHPNPMKTAVVIDVFANAVFGGIIQLCDNYMFYNRYLCISLKTPQWKRVMIHSFIWLVLMLTWFPQYTFLPLGIDTNTPEFMEMQSNFTHLQSWAMLAFNMYFSYEFAVILYQRHNGNLVGASNIDGRVIVAIKSIIHCFVTGITGVLWLWYYFPATVAWEICILSCLHFLFNAKIEKVLLKLRSNSVGSQTRSKSEQDQSNKSSNNDTTATSSTLAAISSRIKNLITSAPKPGIFGRNSVAQSTAELVEQLEMLDAEAEMFLSKPFFTRVARVVADQDDGGDHAIPSTGDGGLSSQSGQQKYVQQGDLDVEEIV